MVFFVGYLNEIFCLLFVGMVVFSDILYWVIFFLKIFIFGFGLEYLVILLRYIVNLDKKLFGGEMCLNFLSLLIWMILICFYRFFWILKVCMVLLGCSMCWYLVYFVFWMLYGFKVNWVCNKKCIFVF